MKLKKNLLVIGLSFSIVASNIIGTHALSNVDIIKGSDRYETAAMIADKQNYNSVILVNADNSLSDGLSSSGLAGASNSPILLTQKNSIPNITKDRLKNIKKVYIIGGTSAVSKTVENSLTAQNKNVIRLGGEDRIETSYKVADEIKSLGKKIDKVIYTNAYKGEADAMSASPVAAKYSDPIILTNGNSTTYKVNDAKNYAVGGSSVISPQFVKNYNISNWINGEDRFDTNKQLINIFYPNVHKFYLSKADVLVDALTASTIAKDAPVVFADVMSDKTILRGATQLTALGGLDKVTTQRCINATDPQDLYYKDKFNSELNYLKDYNSKMSEKIKAGTSTASKYAASSKDGLKEQFDKHLMINSNSAKYNKMTELFNQEIAMNNAVYNMDSKTASSCSNNIVQILSDLDKL